MYWWCSPPKIGTGRGRVRRDRSPKFNLARATKRTYIRIIVPRPQPPSYAARKKPRCLFCRGFAFIYRRLLNAVALWMLQIWLKRRNKFWPSLNGLLNNKFSTWAAASSTICSRGRPKFLPALRAHRQDEREGSRTSGVACFPLASGRAPAGNCSTVARWPSHRRESSTTCPSGNSNAS
jgi:hypothetical protein